MTLLVAAGLALAAFDLAFAQARDGQAPPPTPKAAAPIDLTGYWVSVVSQDWRWRMVPPAKGDYAGIPITAEAMKAGDAWDPAKDEASGEQCKSYGAPAIMRVPTRLHATWQDEKTLKVETDAGMQTRLFHFGTWKPARAAASWQGESVASWETPPPARGGNADAPKDAPKSGSLKVVTSSLRRGYLRKNGVPYSGDAVLTEYWDLFKEPNGDRWITITSTVEDSQYLREPYLTATHFKKEPGGAKWDPQPCSARF